MTPPAAHRPLADLLQRQADGILGAWERRIATPDHPHYLARRAELHAWLEGHLRAMVAALTSGEPAELTRYAESVGRQRPREGFDIGEAIAAWLSFPPAVCPFLLGAFGNEKGALAEALDALYETVRVAVSPFAALFAQELQRAEAEDRRRREHLAVLEERQKLARDLHDSVNQDVYGVSVYAEAAIRRLRSGDLDKVEDHLGQVRDSAADALRELRLLIYELRPPVLAEEGLVGALRSRLATVEERSGISARLTSEDVGRLPCRVEDELYGIAHEALNNALKHSSATEIDVSLAVVSCADKVGAVAGAVLTLTIADNGGGFAPAQATSTGGVGVAGMRERAVRLGATMSVQSAPGAGTRITVAVPLPEAGAVAAWAEDAG
jgi:signal transduction histidine kinase